VRVNTKWDDALYNKKLDDFKLDRKQIIKTYSKGMTMKLAIAAALSHHPKLLILDEATSGLDPVMREEMLDVFLDFVGDENHSILLSSHITSDLEKVADYITFIHEGKIILSAKKDDLLYRYGIMRCKAEQFAKLEKDDFLAYRKREYQIDVLVSDIKMAQRKYKDIVIDAVSVDEMMLLLVKGEKA
jgi:ABC-2 type transport system ATP-binding protein